jgi:hypothetical protein
MAGSVRLRRVDWLLSFPAVAVALGLALVAIIALSGGTFVEVLLMVVLFEVPAVIALVITRRRGL